MITYVTYDNLAVTGGAFCAQFRLRHKCFIERQTYRVRTYAKKEYDQYDTPAAVYLVYGDGTGAALGASRLTPTREGCMLADLWPEMVARRELLGAPNVWEGTRFCVDHDAPPELRKRITQELVLGYLEFGLQAGIETIIGVMPRLILRTVFRGSGVAFETLGPSRDIDGVQVQAAAMEISRRQLASVLQATGLQPGILQPPPAFYTPPSQEQRQAA
jgi:N-acyl-L-homoserine lactone synthetase